jgi:hypothetical protein
MSKLLKICSVIFTALAVLYCVITLATVILMYWKESFEVTEILRNGFMIMGALLLVSVPSLYFQIANINFQEFREKISLDQDYTSEFLTRTRVNVPMLILWLCNLLFGLSSLTLGLFLLYRLGFRMNLFQTSLGYIQVSVSILLTIFGFIIPYQTLKMRRAIFPESEKPILIEN